MSKIDYLSDNERLLALAEHAADTLRAAIDRGLADVVSVDLHLSFHIHTKKVENVVSLPLRGVDQVALWVANFGGDVTMMFVDLGDAKRYPPYANVIARITSASGVTIRASVHLSQDEGRRLLAANKLDGDPTDAPVYLEPATLLAEAESARAVAE